MVVVEGGRGGGGEATLANEARVLQQTASGYGAVHRPSADRREEVEAGGRAGEGGRVGGAKRIRQRQSKSSPRCCNTEKIS